MFFCWFILPFSRISFSGQLSCRRSFPDFFILPCLNIFVTVVYTLSPLPSENTPGKNSLTKFLNWEENITLNCFKLLELSLIYLENLEIIRCKDFYTRKCLSHTKEVVSPLWLWTGSLQSLPVASSNPPPPPPPPPSIVRRELPVIRKGWALPDGLLTLPRHGRIKR